MELPTRLIDKVFNHLLVKVLYGGDMLIRSDNGLNVLKQSLFVRVLRLRLHHGNLFHLKRSRRIHVNYQVLRPSTSDHTLITTALTSP